MVPARRDGCLVKTIFLLRHAKSSWKDTAIEDRERPLAKRGQRAAQVMADHVARTGILPAQILCSPARRARETLEIVERGFASAVPVRMESGIYDAEAAALLQRVQGLSETLGSVMIIGHNPGMERFAHILAGGGDAAAVGLMAAKYPTGALATLEADVDAWADVAPGCARLTAFVRPRDLSEE